MVVRFLRTAATHELATAAARDSDGMDLQANHSEHRSEHGVLPRLPIRVQAHACRQHSLGISCCMYRKRAEHRWLTCSCGAHLLVLVQLVAAADVEANNWLFQRL